MKVVFNKALGGEIDVDKTEWCCDQFKNASSLYKDIYDGDMYLGAQPLYRFNYEHKHPRFEKITDGMMFGNGGFGDRFWGDKLTECPFCGKKIGSIKKIFI